jgi:tetratricopeptide (TPR) repeat protein
VLAAPRIEARAARLDAAREREVAELGYGAKAEGEIDYPDPFELGSLPQPDMDERAALVGAENLAREGKAAEAIQTLELLRTKNPANLEVLDELALALIAQKEWSRASEVLLERLHHPPERLATHQGLVQCFTELHEPERAREHTLRALEILIALHERRGEHAEAERYRAIYAAGRKSSEH